MAYRAFKFDPAIAKVGVEGVGVCVFKFVVGSVSHLPVRVTAAGAGGAAGGSAAFERAVPVVPASAQAGGGGGNAGGVTDLWLPVKPGATLFAIVSDGGRGGKGADPGGNAGGLGGLGGDCAISLTPEITAPPGAYAAYAFGGQTAWPGAANSNAGPGSGATFQGWGFSPHFGPGTGGASGAYAAGMIFGVQGGGGGGLADQTHGGEGGFAIASPAQWAGPGRQGVMLSADGGNGMDALLPGCGGGGGGGGAPGGKGGDGGKGAPGMIEVW